MPDPIFISDLKGLELFIAKLCDKDSNGKLEKTENFDEISLFNDMKTNYHDIFSKVSIFSNIAPADATYVAPLPEVKAKEAELELNTKLSPEKVAPLFPEKITKSSGVTRNPETIYDADILNKALNSMLEGNSKMRGMASAFIESASQRGLDPFILIAIAMHESASGTSKAAREKNNIGGLMGKHGSLRFDTVEACVDSMATTVNSRVKEGRTTINSIAQSGRYCAKSSAPVWAARVVSFAEELRNKYNQLISEKR